MTDAAKNPIEDRLVAWAAQNPGGGAAASLAREAAIAIGRLRTELAALTAAKVAIGSAASAKLVLDAPLDEPEALFALCDMIEDWEDPSGIRLRAGDGASGYGLYVSSLDEPDWPERMLYHLDPPGPISV